MHGDDRLRVRVHQGDGCQRNIENVGRALGRLLAQLPELLAVHGTARVQRLHALFIILGDWRGLERLAVEIALQLAHMGHRCIQCLHDRIRPQFLCQCVALLLGQFIRQIPEMQH
ncbi:hypothetical protein SDC9_139964 [bioreactor metagenome]|uniref:Uncharacterized protein n=1 Tax=bioreactor metagenome TaxID=1076179 RepID=A0A645DUM4_9ZZZZ